MSTWKKNTVDGGESRIVQEARTSLDSSILLIERRYYTGKHGFDVARAVGKWYLVLERGLTEDQAREAANKHWKHDRAR